ncbi:MAG: type III-A CRISPR-associated protein Csm2 [Dehalococcoidia bacterium]|nr:type III-A CRISPR-associated protein Csm2 [Dehalococcoidia bacterium]
MRDRGGYSHSPAPRRSSQWERRPPARLPEGYLQKGYFDSKGNQENLWPEIMQSWPEEIARLFKMQGLSSNQLRRFFNRARALERQLDSGAKNFDRLKEDIAAFKHLAAAAVGKKNAPELFKTFMDKNIDLILQSSNPNAFKRGFLMHLQGIVAYVRYLEENKGGNR